MLKTMNNPILSYDKYTCLCSGTGNVTTFLHLIIKFHKEVIDCTATGTDANRACYKDEY